MNTTRLFRIVTTMLVIAAAVLTTNPQNTCFFSTGLDRLAFSCSSPQCETTCSFLKGIQNACTGLIDLDAAAQCRCEQRRVFRHDGSLAVLPSDVQNKIITKTQVVQQALPLHREYQRAVPIEPLLWQSRSPVLDVLQSIVLLI